MSNEQKLEEAVPQNPEQTFASTGSPGEAGESAPAIAPARERTAGVTVTGGSAGQVSAAASCPTCVGSASQGAENDADSFIFALGSITTQFPSLDVEKEFAQSAKEGDTANLTDPQLLYNVVKDNPHLAYEVCWVFSVENIETYILVPKDPRGLDQLVEAIKPAPKGTDVAVVVGVRGPVASPEMCNGLQVPVVAFDRIWSFDRAAFVKEVPKPKGMDEKVFRASVEELFDRIQQMADNTGTMDEHRVLNYLAVRYPALYSLTAEMHANDCSLTGIEVIPSRLSGSAGRTLLDVVIAFTHRTTDVLSKYYVRVDASAKYLFLVSKLTPFYDR